jgi:DNA polymerase III delta subunit
VTADAIANSVAFQREREIKDLTAALAAGDAAEALRRWRQLVQIDSSAEFRAVTWIGIWLENVRQAITMSKSGMNPFAIGGALRIWPREAAVALVENARKLGEAGANRALDLLAEIDHQTKTGVGDAAGNIERFILAVAG